MKQIRTNSKANTYNFCKGDIVFVINSKKVDGVSAAKVKGQVGQTIMTLLATMFAEGIIGGWEMCTEEDGTIKGFCINNIKSKNPVDGLVKVIKDGLNEFIIGKADKLITDTYQLI